MSTVGTNAELYADFKSKDKIKKKFTNKTLFKKASTVKTVFIIGR